MRENFELQEDQVSLNLKYMLGSLRSGFVWDFGLQVGGFLDVFAICAALLIRMRFGFFGSFGDGSLDSSCTVA